MSSTGESIIARARVLATEMGMDANQSPVIDSKPALRALLNHSIREVYRQFAKDPKFIKDINRRNTITMVAGAGALPDTVMRQFLHQADWEDVDGSLISYFDYPADVNSGQNYDQLGYVSVVGDIVNYTPPSPGTSTSYTDNLFVTVPCFPIFPVSMASDIPMTDETTDNVILTMSLAIRGQLKFDLAGTITA